MQLNCIYSLDYLCVAEHGWHVECLGGSEHEVTLTVPGRWLWQLPTAIASNYRRATVGINPTSWLDNDVLRNMQNEYA